LVCEKATRGRRTMGRRILKSFIAGLLLLSESAVVRNIE
jgi:hypothetical protein